MSPCSDPCGGRPARCRRGVAARPAQCRAEFGGREAPGVGLRPRRRAGRLGRRPRRGLGKLAAAASASHERSSALAARRPSALRIGRALRRPIDQRLPRAALRADGGRLALGSARARSSLEHARDRAGCDRAGLEARRVRSRAARQLDRAMSARSARSSSLRFARSAPAPLARAILECARSRVFDRECVSRVRSLSARSSSRDSPFADSSSVRCSGLARAPSSSMRQTRGGALGQRLGVDQRARGVDAPVVPMTTAPLSLALP